MDDTIHRSYEGFAYVYDTFMDNVPYEEWAEYVTGILEEYGITDGLVLDLGCGTGSMTELLAEKGYDMIGVDLSADMLEIAMDKRSRKGLDILYLQQDMREFELYGTVRAIVCICDSINYLESEEDLLEVLRLANNYLDPGGIFVFDLNTPYKYREILGDSVIAENREECSFIWENFYDSEDQINEYDLTIFVEEDQKEGLYRRFTETHYQRGYRLDQIRRLLEESGLVFVEALDADTMQEVTEKSERVFCIASEHGKCGTGEAK